MLVLLTGLALYLGNRFHARDFRRRLSRLVPGIAVCLALGVVGLSTQLSEAGHLHYAKQEAYDSALGSAVGGVRLNAAANSVSGMTITGYLGTEPGQSNYAFHRYMTELDSVIQINDAAFASGIASGLDGVGVGSWVGLLVGVLLLLLCVAQAGYSRLREYR